MQNTLKCKQKLWRWEHWLPCEGKVWKDGCCKRHHPDSIADRNAKHERDYAAKRKQSLPYLFGEALKKIKELENEIARLKNL